MGLHIFNSYSRKKEEFIPEDPGDVRIYNCGPTVYNFNHIGNFRSYIFVDILRRYLTLRGYKVNHTSNITDVDDKIIDNCISRNQSIEEFTGPFISAFLADLKTLNIQPVEHRPRATSSIETMINLIKNLENYGHIYKQDGSVYFRLSSFRDYGKLSGIEAESLKTAAGERFDADEYSKDDARDFALWKAPSRPGEITWESPYGSGRPGWHLECSAMIRDIYGKGGIDIHCGGIDLLFPHHENEIAQSRAAWPEDNFVRYWMHNEHLLVDSKKMSKSLGNFYTLRDLTDLPLAETLVKENRAPDFILNLIKKHRMPRALRYTLASVHYRAKLNFTFDSVKAADSACDRVQTLIPKLMAATGLTEEKIHAAAMQLLLKDPPGKGCDSVRSAAAVWQKAGAQAMGEFLDAMDDDLNTSKALAAAFDLVRHANTALESGILSREEAEFILIIFYIFNSVFDVWDFSGASVSGHDEEADASDPEVREIQELIEKRNEARRNKDFALSDSYRDQLLARGIRIKDTKEGTSWERI